MICRKNKQLNLAAHFDTVLPPHVQLFVRRNLIYVVKLFDGSQRYQRSKKLPWKFQRSYILFLSLLNRGISSINISGTEPEWQQSVSYTPFYRYALIIGQDVTEFVCGVCSICAF
jgi:hypothetical protein